MTEIGHVAYQSMRLDEINTMKRHPQRSSSVQSRVIDENGLQPPMTSDDLSRGYWLKQRTLTIAAVPNHPDFERFELFLCVHMDLKAFPFFSIDL